MKFKLKKINAVLAAVTTDLLYLHTAIMVFTMLTGFKYLLVFKILGRIFVVFTALHMIVSLVLLNVFHDKPKKQRVYPKQNKKMMIQRLSGIMIFILTIFHLIIYEDFNSGIEIGTVQKILIIVSQICYYAVAFGHTAISFTGIGIAMGKIRSDEKEKELSKKISIVCLALFVISTFASVFSIIRY